MALCVATFRWVPSQLQLTREQDEYSVCFLYMAPSAPWDGQPERDKRKMMPQWQHALCGSGWVRTRGVLVHYSRHMGVTLFFEGWLIQLLTQYNLQIAFYNKNAKYIYSSIFEVNFCKCFHKWRENLWIFLGGEVILSSSMADFNFVSCWYQFYLKELTPLLTRNYTRKSFHFISWWKQDLVSPSSPKTMDTKLHRVWLACT